MTSRQVVYDALDSCRHTHIAEENPDVAVELDERLDTICDLVFVAATLEQRGNKRAAYRMLVKAGGRIVQALEESGIEDLTT